MLRLTLRETCRGALYWSEFSLREFTAWLSGILKNSSGLESDRLMLEFLVSFLIVFTVFRTAVNSDFIYSSTVSSWLLSCLSSPGWNQQRTLPIFLSMACLPIGLDVFMGRSLSSFR